MPGTLRSDLRCLECGRALLMVGHLHGGGEVVFEYLHADDKGDGPSEECRVRYPPVLGLIQEVIESTLDVELRVEQLTSLFRVFCLPQPKAAVDASEPVFQALAQAEPESYTEIEWSPPPSPEPPAKFVPGLVRCLIESDGDDKRDRLAVFGVFALHGSVVACPELADLGLSTHEEKSA